MIKHLAEIALDKLEHESFWVATHAIYITTAITMLSGRPEWRTKAQAALDDAEVRLINALNIVRAAKAEYEHKPIVANIEAAE